MYIEDYLVSAYIHTPVILILQSWSPAFTFSPSGTNSSSITPDTGEGTGSAVWEQDTGGGRD